MIPAWLRWVLAAEISLVLDIVGALWSLHVRAMNTIERAKREARKNARSDAHLVVQAALGKLQKEIGALLGALSDFRTGVTEKFATWHGLRDAAATQ